MLLGGTSDAPTPGSPTECTAGCRQGWVSRADICYTAMHQLSLLLQYCQACWQCINCQNRREERQRGTALLTAKWLGWLSSRPWLYHQGNSSLCYPPCTNIQPHVSPAIMPPGPITELAAAKPPCCPAPASVFTSNPPGVPPGCIIGASIMPPADVGAAAPGPPMATGPTPAAPAGSAGASTAPPPELPGPPLVGCWWPTPRPAGAYGRG